MRVLQLIDSLNPGGAETVAVSYANALLSVTDGSYLCTTRAEGLLQEKIDRQVGYLFLKRQRTLDFGAITRLIKFCKKHNIHVIHAHATSFFIARVAVLFLPKCTLVWHDHYGNSELLNQRPTRWLGLFSKRFDAIIAVNQQLKDWAEARLKSNRVYFLKNAVPKPESNLEFKTKLNGKAGKRIVHLANFRAQKDHLNVLTAFSEVVKSHPDASLHLVGMHWNDSYYESVLNTIASLKIEKQVSIHGPVKQAYQVLLQANIGVLSSASEGLPMALLEYGMAGLAVVCTAVGQCQDVVKGHGQCVAPNNSTVLANALNGYLGNQELLKSNAESYKNHIEQQYSIQSIIPKLLTIYENSHKAD